MHAAGLDRIDLTLSSVALGKEDGGHSSIAARAAAIERAGTDAALARASRSPTRS